MAIFSMAAFSMPEPHQEPVILNIYDLCCANHCSFCSRLGLGAYHSGVEIYGIEFGYSGHQHDTSGIFELEPREYEKVRERISYKTSIEIGHTSLTQFEIYQAMERLGTDFKGCHYHALNKNCNHFSSALTKLLCDKEVPGWVNRAARFATYVPFLEKCVPTTGEMADLEARNAPAQPAPPAPASNVSATPVTPEENNNNTISEQPGIR